MKKIKEIVKRLWCYTFHQPYYKFGTPNILEFKGIVTVTCTKCGNKFLSDEN